MVPIRLPALSETYRIGCRSQKLLWGLFFAPLIYMVRSKERVSQIGLWRGGERAAYEKALTDGMDATLADEYAARLFSQFRQNSPSMM